MSRCRHTRTMDFEIPADIQHTLDELDAFIAAEIKPLEEQDDNIRFFDHRREWAAPTSTTTACRERTGRSCCARCAGAPTPPAGCAGAAGGVRWPGRQQPEMAIIREHLAHKGLGLHNDLQNESSIVGNFPTVLMMGLRHRTAEG